MSTQDPYFRLHSDGTVEANGELWDHPRTFDPNLLTYGSGVHFLFTVVRCPIVLLQHDQVPQAPVIDPPIAATWSARKITTRTISSRRRTFSDKVR